MVGSVQDAVPARISPPSRVRMGRLAASPASAARWPAEAGPGSWGSGEAAAIPTRLHGGRRERRCAIVSPRTGPGMERLQAQFDFDASRRQAFWNDLRAVLGGRARTLLSFREVLRLARPEGQFDRGVQDVPLTAIRGSEARVRDFD